MNKYNKIENRLESLEQWFNIAAKLTEDNSKITLDEQSNIQNDFSEFIEKIRLNNGEMVILKEQKGTFGFPFETELEGKKWFTKLALYDIYLRVPKLEYPNNYFKLPSNEKIEFHKKIIQHKQISVNTEHSVNSLMTKLVKDKVTPHICILYGATELYQKKHEELFQVLIKKYKKSDKDSLLYAAKVLMTEWCTLGEFAENIENNKYKWSEETWRVLIFQLLAMLALIQEKYPSFRHNDLSLCNVLVQNSRLQSLDETEYPGYYKYNINGKVYCVPDIGITLVLSDFDYCTINELDITNEKISNDYTKKFGTTADTNPSYDCHYMLNWLDLYILQLNRKKVELESLKKLKDFYNSIFDNDYRGENNRFLKFARFRTGKKVVDKFIPKNILETNEYFNEFRNCEEWIKDRVFIEEYNKPRDTPTVSQNNEVTEKVIE